MTDCTELVLIKQTEETCWFNAILTALFYSERSRKVLIKTSKTWNNDSLFKIFKTILKYSDSNFNIQNKTDIQNYYKKIRPEKLLLKIAHKYDKDLKDTLNNNFLGSHYYIIKFLQIIKANYIDVVYNYTNNNCIIKYLQYLKFKTFELFNKKLPYVINQFSNINKETIINDINYTLTSKPDYLILFTNKTSRIFFTMLNTNLQFSNYKSLFFAKNNRINKDDILSVKHYSEIIIFNKDEYILDSCLLSNYNLFNNKIDHVICGITCDKKKYIYNSHYEELIKFDWFNDKRDFIYNDNTLNFTINKKELCYSFDKGERIYIYVKKTNEDTEILNLSKSKQSISDFKNIIDSHFINKTYSKNELIKKILVNNPNTYYLNDLKKYNITELKKTYINDLYKKYKNKTIDDDNRKNLLKIIKKLLYGQNNFDFINYDLDKIYCKINDKYNLALLEIIFSTTYNTLDIDNFIQLINNLLIKYSIKITEDNHFYCAFVSLLLINELNHNINNYITTPNSTHIINNKNLFLLFKNDYNNSVYIIKIINNKNFTIIFDIINGYIFNFIFNIVKNLPQFILPYKYSFVSYYKNNNWDFKELYKNYLNNFYGFMYNDETKPCYICINELCNIEYSFKSLFETNDNDNIAIILNNYPDFVDFLLYIGFYYGFTHNDLHFDNIIIDKETKQLKLFDFSKAIFLNFFVAKQFEINNYIAQELIKLNFENNIYENHYDNNYIYIYKKFYKHNEIFIPELNDGNNLKYGFNVYPFIIFDIITFYFNLYVNINLYCDIKDDLFYKDLSFLLDIQKKDDNNFTYTFNNRINEINIFAYYKTLYIKHDLNNKINKPKKYLLEGLLLIILLIKHKNSKLVFDNNDNSNFIQSNGHVLLTMDEKIGFLNYLKDEIKNNQIINDCNHHIFNYMISSSRITLQNKDNIIIESNISLFDSIIKQIYSNKNKSDLTDEKIENYKKSLQQKVQVVPRKLKSSSSKSSSS